MRPIIFFGEFMRKTCINSDRNDAYHEAPEDNEVFI